MINYFGTFTNTNGVVFPGTEAINSSGPSTTDGTEFVKAMIDDHWGARQALMDRAGLTPTGVSESVSVSQFLEAIEKAFVVGPGIPKEWHLNSDPASLGYRALPMNGQGVLRANYPLLDAAVYVGDGNNATASVYYHADDAAGTIRNIAGIYLIIEESRGYFVRGLDTAASIDPDGASRDLGSKQIDAFQSHLHNIQAAGGTSNLMNASEGSGPVTSGRNAAFGGISSQELVETTSPIIDGASGTPRTSTETRGINRATNFVLTY